MKRPTSVIRTPALYLASLIGHTVRIANVLPGLAGAAMVSWGASMIYEPAGWVAGGAFLLAFGFENNAKKAPKPPAGHRAD